jgi:hypothetical protein
MLNAWKECDSRDHRGDAVKLQFNDLIVAGRIRDANVVEGELLYSRFAGAIEHCSEFAAKTFYAGKMR